MRFSEDRSESLLGPLTQIRTSSNHHLKISLLVISHSPQIEGGKSEERLTKASRTLEIPFRSSMRVLPITWCN